MSLNLKQLYSSSSGHEVHSGRIVTYDKLNCIVSSRVCVTVYDTLQLKLIDQLFPSFKVSSVGVLHRDDRRDWLFVLSSRLEYFVYSYDKRFNLEFKGVLFDGMRNEFSKKRLFVNQNTVVVFSGNLYASLVLNLDECSESARYGPYELQLHRWYDLALRVSSDRSLLCVLGREYNGGKRVYGYTLDQRSLGPKKRLFETELPGTSYALRLFSSGIVVFYEGGVSSFDYHGSILCSTKECSPFYFALSGVRNDVCYAFGRRNKLFALSCVQVQGYEVRTEEVELGEIDTVKTLGVLSDELLFAACVTGESVLLRILPYRRESSLFEVANVRKTLCSVKSATAAEVSGRNVLYVVGGSKTKGYLSTLACSITFLVNEVDDTERFKQAFVLGNWLFAVFDNKTAAENSGKRTRVLYDFELIHLSRRLVVAREFLYYAGSLYWSSGRWQGEERQKELLGMLKSMLLAANAQRKRKKRREQENRSLRSAHNHDVERAEHSLRRLKPAPFHRDTTGESLDNYLSTENIHSAKRKKGLLAILLNNKRLLLCTLEKHLSFIRCVEEDVVCYEVAFVHESVSLLYSVWGSTLVTCVSLEGRFNTYNVGGPVCSLASTKTYVAAGTAEGVLYLYSKNFAQSVKHALIKAPLYVYSTRNRLFTNKTLSAYLKLKDFNCSVRPLRIVSEQNDFFRTAKIIDNVLLSDSRLLKGKFVKNSGYAIEKSIKTHGVATHVAFSKERVLCCVNQAKSSSLLLFTKELCLIDELPLEGTVQAFSLAKNGVLFLSVTAAHSSLLTYKTEEEKDDEELKAENEKTSTAKRNDSQRSVTKTKDKLESLFSSDIELEEKTASPKQCQLVTALSSLTTDPPVHLLVRFLKGVVGVRGNYLELYEQSDGIATICSHASQLLPVCIDAMKHLLVVGDVSGTVSLYTHREEENAFAVTSRIRITVTPVVCAFDNGGSVIVVDCNSGMWYYRLSKREKTMSREGAIMLCGKYRRVVRSKRETFMLSTEGDVYLAREETGGIVEERIPETLSVYTDKGLVDAKNINVRRKVARTRQQ